MQALPGPTSTVASFKILRQLLEDPTKTLDDVAEEYGGSFALKLGPLRFAVIGKPSDLAELFDTPNDSFKWGYAMNVLGFVVGPTSMLVSDGGDHKRRRGFMQPALARRRVDHWISMIVAETDAMIDDRLLPAMAKSESIDLYPYGKDLILGITVKAFFGSGLQRRTAEIGGIFDELQAYLELPGYRQAPHPIPFTTRASARKARRAFDRLLDEEVARRTATPNRDETESSDLLDSFMAESGDDLTAQEISDQVTSLIGAGFNTTSASLGWTVQRALTTPGVWEKLVAEAAEVFGDVDSGSTSSSTTGEPAEFGTDLARQLPYAAAVVHESLRLHPPGAFAPRQAVKEVAVGKYTIPKNSMILWSPYLSGRDETSWNDPLEFRPERHIDPTPEAAAAMKQAWAPFGGGPRRCIGFALAQTELIVILARLAHRVDMRAINTQTPGPTGMVVNRPDGGVPIALREPAEALTTAG